MKQFFKALAVIVAIGLIAAAVYYFAFTSVPVLPQEVVLPEEVIF